jgi:hypothetical protein
MKDKEDSAETWVKKAKLYQFYNILSEAHCFKTKDSPLCAEKLGAVKGDPENPLLKLCWKVGRKKRSVIFTEHSLLNARIAKDKISLLDSEGNTQELFLFVLNNMLEDVKPSTKISQTFIDPFSNPFDGIY